VNGDTALMAAAGRGSLDSVKLLLQRGADLSIRNAAGKNATDLSANPSISSALKGETYQSAVHY